MPSVRRLLPLLTLSLAGPASAAPTPEQVAFFETKVRPVLVEHCVNCHGEKKQRSDLRLDIAAGVLKGGASGDPLVTPADPANSLLVRSVRHADGVAAMPPKSKLSDAQIADLTKWAAMGAPFPEAVARVDPRDRPHWAFQPVKRPAVPDARGAKLDARNPVDAFVNAKLAESGLKPNPPADRRALIRRATFDLTGLPPTPAEVDAFLADASPNAFEKLVDRLLASPAYGERWGRHWLDVARYADSNGLDENIAHGNAWRYRDYVVQSFNDDVPYDRFVREQIAGDLLPAADDAARKRQLIATGFLALGPKVLAEPDPKKMELDIVDEQIDTLGKAFMGLTLGCARCHDHKFDPISTADYYALAGVFLSTRTMESFKIVARWHENPIGTPQQAARRAAHDAEVSRFKARVKEYTGKTDPAGKSALKAAKEAVAKLEKFAPDLPTAMGVTEGTVRDVPVLKRGDHLTPGKVVARRFPTVMAGERQKPFPADHSGRLELANWLADPANPLTARVMANRVWRWHFGAGLVRSVDNFGLLGDPPTHPELLDWLATEFAAGGWSVKKLHRLVMLTAAYQRASAHNAAAAERDPDNRLLWRANVRRLEAEAIRDALLAVGGGLDRTAGGPALAHVKNRGFLFDHTSKDLTKYDTPRRTVYLPVVRNNLYDVLQLFDATDAAVLSGDRATTTVATQALFWMNSPLVADAADALVGRLLARDDLDDAGRVTALYETAYGRPPTAKEVARALTAVGGFETVADGPLESGKRRQRAWGLFAHVVLSANEFVYVP